MCLDTVLESANIEDGLGYKVFCKFRGKLFSEFSKKGERKSLPVGKWLKEEDYRIKGLEYEGPPLYGYGWHIFTVLRDAKRWGFFKIYRVKFRKATTKGFLVNERLPTTVAKEIYIFPEEIK